MNRKLSHVTQTVRLRFPKPNPTCASPYSCRRRCQNRWLSPDGTSRRGRSQASAAMRCREEARQRYSGGCRVGPEGRASLLRFGEAWDRGLWRSPEASHTVRRFELLGWVAMSPGDNGLLFIPVTIPRRLCSSLGSGRVTPAYKVTPKWLADAVVQLTSPRRRLLQGYQQRRSSHPRMVKACTLTSMEVQSRSRKQLAPWPQATKWPDRQPFPVNADTAKKHFQIARPRFPCGSQS